MYDNLYRPNKVVTFNYSYNNERSGILLYYFDICYLSLLSLPKLKKS